MYCRNYMKHLQTFIHQHLIVFPLKFIVHLPTISFYVVFYCITYLKNKTVIYLRRHLTCCKKRREHQVHPNKMKIETKELQDQGLDPCRERLLK